MKVLLDVIGKSQYDTDIIEKYRASACGPVTAYVLMQNILDSSMTNDINQLYKKLGVTRIGLFKRRFIKNMKKLLGQGWIVKETDIEGVKKELCEGRPVAAKFDRYFSFHWRTRFDFSYHWVPIIGFEETENGLNLIIHDNGGRNKQSKVRTVPYERNKKILSFVRISPLRK